MAETGRVLIVDDLPFMRGQLRAIAEAEGFTVAGEAVNGRDGVRKFVVLEPDIVLLDITMPVLDGISALRKILAYDPDARVIMCSALDEEELIQRALHIGARDYIVKPFLPQRVATALLRTIGSRSPGLGV